MDKIKHYICTGGCGGEADKSDVCKSETCSDRGKPFKECDCSDKGHTDAINKKEQE